LPVPHDQVIGIGTAGALPEAFCRFAWSWRLDPTKRLQPGLSDSN
jgi:hypothetical protein